jgi:hypothetical protein
LIIIELRLTAESLVKNRNISYDTNKDIKQLHQYEKINTLQYEFQHIARISLFGGLYDILLGLSYHQYLASKTYKTNIMSITDMIQLTDMYLNYQVKQSKIINKQNILVVYKPNM